MQGEDLLKHGRHGKPKMHYFRLVDQDARLSWRSAKGVIRTVPLRAVLHIKTGQQTDTFKKHLMPAVRGLSRAGFNFRHCRLGGMGVRGVGRPEARGQPEAGVQFLGSGVWGLGSMHGAPAECAACIVGRLASSRSPPCL